MTFLLPAELSAETVRELERACVAGGPDNMPWPTKVQIEPGRMLLHRDVDESGYLVVPWEIDGAGLIVGATATLMERPVPYHLQVELARGKVNQLRNQASDWQAGGLLLPDDLQEQIRSANRTFGRAVTGQLSEQTAQQAQSALVQSYGAAERLAQTYMDQVFAVRHQREPLLQTELGCRLETFCEGAAGRVLAQACNSICIPFTWSAIEATEGNYNWQKQDAILDWAEAQGLAVTGGPLIDFSSAQMPDWLWLWERDLTSLAKFMSSYLSATLKRYQRRIRRWQLTSASNSASILAMGEEELLWLTVKLTQVARQIDAEFALVVGIAQPWGEYMAYEDRTHSPFVFADTLIRSELNLAALDVEVVMGVTPRGSYCRDLLETSRLLDLYALLGVPLRVTLAYPSSTAPDPDADPELRGAAGSWHGRLSPAIQADWAQAYAALALCKPYVQAVHWAQLSDAGAHQFPHCGLFDAADKPKPILDRFLQLREKHVR